MILFNLFAKYLVILNGVSKQNVCLLWSAADVEMDRLKEQLNVVAVPEQFFGSNLLRLSHKASGIELRFDAMGALRGWSASSSLN